MSLPAAQKQQRAALARVLLLLAASIAAVWWPKLSPATGFLALAVGLSIPRMTSPLRGWTWSALALSIVASSAGFGRFVLKEAIPGVLAGGQAAVRKHTVAFLRTVVAAQDKLRQSAELDHDADGIGSAALLSELAGVNPLRNGATLKLAPLLLKDGQVLPSADGEVVALGAYLVKICLPVPGGGWTGQRGEAVDEEAAERKYTVFAWPKGIASGAPTESYFLDQHERILVRPVPTGQTTPYLGTTLGPKCGTLPDSDAGWSAWKDKQARETLPGDSSGDQP